MALTEVKVNNEAELESILVMDANQIESGFLVLSHQKKTDGTDALDILGIDSEGVLTVIELKVKKDRNQLKQSLKYLDYIMNQGLDWFRDAYKSLLGDRIIQDTFPQIMLIAPDFDEEMLIEAKYIREDLSIRLYRFKSYIVSEKKEIVLFEENISPVKLIEEKPWKYEDNLNYIKDTDVKEKFRILSQAVKKLDANIQEKLDRYVVRYFINGNKICDLHVKQKYINVEFKTKDESKWNILNQIKSDEQFEESLVMIKSAYELMKSKRKKSDF